MAVFLFLLITVCSVTSSFACFCMPEHPQKQFCNAGGFGKFIFSSNLCLFGPVFSRLISTGEFSALLVDRRTPSIQIILIYARGNIHIVFSEIIIKRFSCKCFINMTTAIV